jgi:hypothetical protein
MQSFEVRLVQGKETKGTYRYENDEADAAITTLYIRKGAFAGGSAPRAIRLVVEEDAFSAAR